MRRGHRAQPSPLSVLEIYTAMWALPAMRWLRWLKGVVPKGMAMNVADRLCVCLDHVISRPRAPVCRNQEQRAQGRQDMSAGPGAVARDGRSQPGAGAKIARTRRRVGLQAQCGPCVCAVRMHAAAGRVARTGAIVQPLAPT
jgi:hypothetical protein